MGPRIMVSGILGNQAATTMEYQQSDPVFGDGRLDLSPLPCLLNPARGRLFSGGTSSPTPAGLISTTTRYCPILPTAHYSTSTIQLLLSLPALPHSRRVSAASQGPFGYKAWAGIRGGLAGR